MGEGRRSQPPAGFVASLAVAGLALTSRRWREALFLAELAGTLSATTDGLMRYAPPTIPFHEVVMPRNPPAQFRNRRSGCTES